MNKYNLLWMGFLFAQQWLSAQVCNTPTAFTMLHGNEIRAYIPNNGGLFSDGNQALFQVPYDAAAVQQTASIFAGGLWMSAQEGSGNILGAVRTYGNGTDYFAGPLNDTFGTTTGQNCTDFNQVWQITRAQIETHLQDYNDDGIIQNPQTVLLTWPGRNNPRFFGEMGFYLPADRDFAPFYDHDGDGNYDPLAGDYPVFEHGDPTAIASHLVWTVFNDNGNTHTESNMQAMLMEVQLTAYSLHCPSDPILNRTIFTRHKLVNHNNLILSAGAFGLWLDFDLGNYNDDYVGTAPLLNAVFAYNADNFDETTSGAVGYGAKPPVQSVKLLNQNLYKAMVYENSASPVNGNPSGSGYHRLLHGIWNDGSVPMHNGQPVNFLYSDAPTDTAAAAFSMINNNVVPNDFRMVMSVNIDTIFPDSIYILDAAYVYHRDTSLADNIEMTNLVYTELPQVQNWYDNGFPASCFPTQTLAVQRALDGLATAELRLYPNPNKGQFTLELPTDATYQFRIFDMTGRLLHQQELNGSIAHSIELLDLQAGMYFYQANDSNNQTFSGKLILNP